MARRMSWYATYATLVIEMPVDARGVAKGARGADAVKSDFFAVRLGAISPTGLVAPIEVAVAA